MRPQRRQPTRLPRPWASPGKNTGVGCHFLLQCMKVKSESEVSQSCLTLSDPMDCSLPGCSVHGILQARVLEWGAIAFSQEAQSCPLISQFLSILCWRHQSLTGSLPLEIFLIIFCCLFFQAWFALLIFFPADPITALLIFFPTDPITTLEQFSKDQTRANQLDPGTRVCRKFTWGAKKLFLKSFLSFSFNFNFQWGFPGGSVSKEPACQCRRPRFNPWVGKMPWRRGWPPTPISLPGECHGQRGLVGLHSMRRRRVRHD